MKTKIMSKIDSNIASIIENLTVIEANLSEALNDEEQEILKGMIKKIYSDLISVRAFES